jgi:hypothetical protein
MMRVNNIKIHCTCVRRCHIETHRTIGLGGEGREIIIIEGVNLIKVKYIHG